MPPTPPLVVRFGSLGDLVQLTVLLDRLAGACGAPCDLLTASRQAATLYRGLGCVGEVRHLASRRRPHLLSPEKRRIVGWLRSRNPSLVCLIETVASAAPHLRRLLVRGGVRPEALVDGGALGRGPLEHTVDFLDRVGTAALARLGASVAETVAPPLPHLALAEDERADCRRWLATRGLDGRRIAVVQTSSRRKNRGRWPTERWAELTGRILAADPGLVLLLSGAPAERDDVAAVAAAAADPRVVTATDDLPLRRLLALLSLAEAYVGLDSGPAHLAAAVTCPVVAMYGRADPRRVAPRGTAPVEVVTALPREQWPDDPVTWHQRNRLEEIAVADVVAAWNRLPRRQPAGTPVAR